VVERCQRSISARSCGVRTMIRADFRPRMAAPGIRDAEREEIPHRPQESPSSRRPVNSEPFLCDVVLSVRICPFRGVTPPAGRPGGSGVARRRRDRVGRFGSWPDGRRSAPGRRAPVPGG
jgi:hypothetical protein